MHRHFETRRRSTCPAAMGRTSVPFFSKAVSLAPAKKGCIVIGTFPACRLFTMSVSILRSGTGVVHSMLSSRCSALRPIVPLAVPFRKDLRACNTIDSGITENGWIGSVPVSCLRGGCLSCNFRRVSLSVGARSDPQSAAMALEYSPSLVLAIQREICDFVECAFASVVGRLDVEVTLISLTWRVCEIFMACS